MPLTQITVEFLKRMPAALRPNPYNIEEFLMALATKGWTVEDMVTSVMSNKPRQPGHVFVRLRDMTEEPPPLRAPDSGKARDLSHKPCTDKSHDPKCEVCSCNICRSGCSIPHRHQRFPEHHVPVPMPDWFKNEYRHLLVRIGMIHDE